jgi:hypothetical protein
MSIMKRDLLITIESGQDTCQDCEFRRKDADSCDLFLLSLDDEGHRLTECKEAEGKMIDTHIRMAAKTAQV